MFPPTPKQLIPLGAALCSILMVPHVSAFIPDTVHRRRRHGHKVAESFDFSSTEAWEDHYQVHNKYLEWHSSISMENLVKMVPEHASSVVLVGCGSSRLPEAIQDTRPDSHLILQDSSETCLNYLRDRYQDTMSYVGGDATRLSQCLDAPVDVIYDKGLMDAIFCNEGWNRPICSLLQESSKMLKDNGIYILVSYRLPPSTMEFLANVGAENHMDWIFNIEGSNNRAGISIASKFKRESLES